MYNTSSKICLISIFLLSSIGIIQQVSAQTVNQNPYTNTWFTGLSQLQFSKNWSSSWEIHERTGQFLTDQGQFLLRPSLDYRTNENTLFSFGYTYIHVNPYKPFNQPSAITEHNIWEQVLFAFHANKVQIQNRIRLEHRWVQNFKNAEAIPTIDTYQFSNRFRYRFNVMFDLFAVKNKTVFFHGFDEFWISQNENLLPTAFNRNWIYLGLGLKFNPNQNIQIGYMQQIDNLGPSLLKTDIIQVTFVKNFDFSSSN